MHTLLQANGTPGLQMLESNVMVRGQDGGGGWACVRWRGQRSGFLNSPSLSTCPSEVKRTMKNQSSRDPA